MTTRRPQGISFRSIALAILIYTLLSNLGDVKKGLTEGWNAASIVQAK